VRSSAGDSAESSPADQQASLQELSSQQRFQQIMRLLQGDAVAARSELLRYLQQHPDNKTARNLLQQIDMPASDYFPKEYRVVELSAGESLSKV
jgi:hypothetical protein